jgi:hypothetical protein
VGVEENGFSLQTHNQKPKTRFAEVSTGMLQRLNGGAQDYCE